VVTLRVSGQDWSYKTPWTKQAPWARVTTGLVVEGRRILTVGTGLGNQTLVEAQKMGQQERTLARVTLLDHEVPLALVEVDDPAFWEGLVPLPLAPRVPREGDATVVRWLESGQLESAKAVVRQVKTSNHGLARVDLLSLEMSSSIQQGGGSEVVLADGRVIGLSTYKAGDVLVVMASPVLAQFLAMAARHPYAGFARHGVTWQPLLNEGTRAHLGLKPSDGGILVNRVMPHGSGAGVLEPLDVVLEVAGLKVDPSGHVDHPWYGRLGWAVLLSDGRKPGDELPVTVLRDGKRVSLKLVLRRMLPEGDLVPRYEFDVPPEYVEVGGLVFQPLTVPYLVTFGDWRRRAPARLVTAFDMEGSWPTVEQPRLVLLAQVLPDPVNLGYQDVNNVIVTAVNGRPVRTLEDVRVGLQAPRDGFHVVDLLPGSGPTRVVLDAAEADSARARVHDLYGLSGQATP
jgi:hypothetical protein